MIDTINGLDSHDDVAYHSLHIPIRMENKFDNFNHNLQYVLGT